MKRLPGEEQEKVEEEATEDIDEDINPFLEDNFSIAKQSRMQA